MLHPCLFGQIFYKVKNYFETELLAKVTSSISNRELSESFLPSAPVICSLVQQFTISESMAAAAAVDVIGQSSKTVWMFLPCWFQSTL